MFPDRASCLRRSSAPVPPAKNASKPAKSKVTVTKKAPIKITPQPVEPKATDNKSTIVKKDSARLEPEPEQVEPPQVETAIAKQDRNTDQPAGQAATTAKLEPPPATTLSALPPPTEKMVLGRRVALVIGNSAYAAVPTLKNPATDAKAIADALKGLGFEKVTLKLDLDRHATWTALTDFADEASRADWAVIYYAGHGIELDGQNYIIPVDARLQSDRKVSFETVPLDNVLEATAGARKFRLVILDACRNNPFLTTMVRVASSRSIGRGLSRIEPQGGVLVAYAAKAGEVALDGDTGNSPFVTALIDELEQPGLEVSLLFRRVRDSVLDLTNGTQEPYTYGSLPGREEFYFKPQVN